MADAMQKTSPSQEEKAWAFAGYLWVLSVFVLLLKKNSPYVQNHAKQGFMLFIGQVLMIIPGIGWIVGLLSIVLAVVGAIKAVTGQPFTIPVVGESWAKKINF